MGEGLAADGVASAALTACADAGRSYLNEISLGILDKLTDGDLLAELRLVEEHERALQAAKHALIAQVDRRGLPGRAGASGTAAMLQQLLRLSPHEAKQRVGAALLLGPRTSLDGQPLEPLLPETAAAQADGLISAEHARVVAAVLDRVPGTVSPDQYAEAERQLVDAAAQLPPREVGQVGKRLLAYLDPDGVLTSDDEHERRREFSLTPMADGSYRAAGYLTPACGAQLQATLSAHAAPVPAVDGSPDQRSHGQRMHDALHGLAGFALRRGELLDSTSAVQLVITMSAEQFNTGTGLAETSFGQLTSVPGALELADEARVALVVRDASGAVLAEGRTKRIATRAQTLALIARDKGCSFPGCDRPPDWCQRHHVQPWIDDGPTDVDNLTLLCGYHHRNFERSGWCCIMRDGLPWWIPPTWLDHDQEPRLNRRIATIGKESD